jgi:UDP-glucose 4-epimerase
MNEDHRSTLDSHILSPGQWQSRNVLITGGGGFIGSTLAIRLHNLGAHVTVVDSFIPEQGGNLFNLNGYDDKINLNIVDIRDSSSLTTLLKEPEILFSLAGQTSHMDSMNDPLNDLSSNCSAQLNLLEACRKHNPSLRIVYASTRQIYGRPEYLPVDESHQIAPVDINGIHKYAAELYHHLYGNVYGIRSSILRLTNTIGPRMRIKDARQTFLGVWVRMLLDQQPIEVWGGQQLRDFNDVEDVVDALMIAAIHEGAVGEIFNLGSEEKISLKDLAELMTEIKGAGDLRIMEYPEARKRIDIGDYYSSFSKFQDLTGWRPSRGLRQTLQRTLDYYQQNIQHYI